jgi:hypothetical protein
MNHFRVGSNFEDTATEIAYELYQYGDRVDTGHWQSLSNVPHTKTIELMHFSIELNVPATRGALASMIKPNLPWAEAHFQERVSGEPLNPGEEYKNWPWYKSGVEDHKQPGRFSHTYMERIWPQYAGASCNEADDPDPHPMHGVRYRYGDLNDLVERLRREPHTRQAYLPIWFPEDIAASVGGHRVPCTLGWHFMLRNDKLHMFYPMRSVDFYRYLRDDIYMAGRLCHWIIEGLRVSEEDAEFKQWSHVLPGRMVLFASSLHVFQAEEARLKNDATPLLGEDDEEVTVHAV